MLQRTQDLRQRAGAQLRASAGAGRERREADLFACEHLVSLGTNESRQRDGTANRRVPDADRERGEQNSEREVLHRSPAANDDKQQEHNSARDEREVKREK